MIYLLLRLLPHLVVLASLLDLLEGSARAFAGLVAGGLSALLSALVVDPLDALGRLATFPAVAAAVILPSPTTLSVVFATRSLTEMGIDLGFAARFMPTLLALSALDVLSKCYRRGQEAYVRHSGLLASALPLGLAMAPLLLLPIGVQGYLGALIEAFSRAARESYLLGLIASNPLFLLVLAAALGVTLYRTLSSLSETAVIFLAKPRSMALELLRRTDDVDVWLRLPLSSVRSLLVAMVFAPPLYYAAALALELAPWLSGLRISVAGVDVGVAAVRTLLLLAVSAVVWKAAGRVFRGPELSSRAALALSLASLGALYALGLYRTASSAGLSPEALARPDLEWAAETVGRAYLSYYSTLFLTLELVLRLLGAAP